MSEQLLAALREFATAVAQKTNVLLAGDPEDQLRAPFERFMARVGEVFGWSLTTTGETLLPDRLGKPDYAVYRENLLTGFVELKAPGTGVDARRFRGHNRQQFKRFSAIPNILYTDGNEWGLYRNGNLARPIVRFTGDIVLQGASAVSPEDARALEPLLRDFLLWEPFVPTNREGQVDLARFAEMLAPLCRLLRDDVLDAMQDPGSPLVLLARDWRNLLFPEASDEQFADAYAQTVTFALLLARSEGADPLTLTGAIRSLAAHHTLLSRALQVLTDPLAQQEISASLNLILRVVAALPPRAFASPQDPWLYFYEDFLAAYDPELRKDAGAYYTPVPVVHAQVRLVDDILTRRLAKPLGFADKDVITLDPALGTGTYLLGVVEHALVRVRKEQGEGAVPPYASRLAKNLYGFEIMVGPYAVAELRFSRTIRAYGGRIPEEGVHIYLTDTLESPHAAPPQPPLILQPIAEQHARALEVKTRVPVLVCLGNPPYDRHAASGEADKAHTGGWVRWGDEAETGKGSYPILEDFIRPALEAGHGVHLKNLYNLYVYFWRWALWKVFEQSSYAGPGVVSFITASSYLDGNAFVGMREHMRRICDEIWIIDLGGEGRGTRRSDNVFDIQTPVAIGIAFRGGHPQPDTPARVYYTRVEGSREDKLAALEAVTGLDSLEWKECSSDWHAPFRPPGEGMYFSWPLLVDLMPWQHSGVQFKRTWPIAPDKETLKRRWRALLKAGDRALAFKETRDRTVHTRCESPWGGGRQQPLASLPEDAPPPPIERYGYRSFDRQWAIIDCRVGDFLRPVLWQTYGERQIYLISLFSQPLGKGPAVTATNLVPDLHYFRGSYGAKDTLPLYRNREATKPNLTPGLLEQLSDVYGWEVTPEDFLAYTYGVLAHPAFTHRFHNELETRQLRVPVTKDPDLFEQARTLGARLLWLHTYGQRFVPEGEYVGHVPRGLARCIKSVPEEPDRYPADFSYDAKTQTLWVGEGAFAPVTPEVYEYEVSGLRVVHSWLRYRMKGGAGRKSSPLDDIRPERWTAQFTTELLELLWVLEATLALHPQQEELLEAVVGSPLFVADELPQPSENDRKAPRPTEKGTTLFDLDA